MIELENHNPYLKPPTGHGVTAEFFLYIFKEKLLGEENFIARASMIEILIEKLQLIDGEVEKFFGLHELNQLEILKYKSIPSRETTHIKQKYLMMEYLDEKFGRENLLKAIRKPAKVLGGLSIIDALENDTPAEVFGRILTLVQLQKEPSNYRK